MVMKQNAEGAITASSTTAITSLRSIATLLRFYRCRPTYCRAPACHQSRGRPVAPTAALDGDDCKRLRGLLAVGLVTAAAILAHLGDLNLEAVEILGCADGGLGIAGKLGELGREIGLVFPNRRQCRGIAAALGIVREECRRLVARLGEGREHLLRFVEIEGPLGLQHVGGNLALIAIGLHQGLAGSDRVALGHERGGAEREHCNDECGADHLSCSLCELISAPGGAALADGHRVNIPMAFFIPGGAKTGTRLVCRTSEFRRVCSGSHRTSNRKTYPSQGLASVLRFRSGMKRCSQGRANCGIGPLVITIP